MASLQAIVGAWLMVTYAQGANGYITKPAGFNEWKRVMRNIEEFWFEVAKLPR